MKPPIKIVGLGAGGHAKVLLDIIRLRPHEYEMIGFLEHEQARHGQRWQGLNILGGDDLLPALARAGVGGFFVGLGSVGRLARRAALFELGRSAGLEPVRLVHPQAVVSPSARLGEGVCVMAGAVVNAEASLEDNVCVNTGAVVEHDCRLGRGSFIGPRAALAGGVQVHEEAFVGLGAVVRQGLQIGARALVAAGAVVIDDVAADAMVGGVPARLISGYG